MTERKEHETAGLSPRTIILGGIEGQVPLIPSAVKSWLIESSRNAHK